MHIPDGFLTTPVAATTYAVTGGSLLYIWGKVRKQFNEQTVPRLAVLAAFIFVAQMINVPVAGGTSGHLLGGFLAALLVGPYAAVFIIALVLTVQMFIFQDGGLTALGANILNMGILGIMGSYLFYTIFTRLGRRFFERRWFRLLAIFLGAWISMEISALFTGIELGLSNMAKTTTVVGLMTSVHALIGLLEGTLTVLIINGIQSIRPDLLYSCRSRKIGGAA